MAGPDREAGFSLIEVLAALALSTLMIVAAFETFGTYTQLTRHRVQATAARHLARRLLAEGATGQGQTQELRWQVVTHPLAPGVIQRRIVVSSRTAVILTTTQAELLGAAP